MKYYMAVIWNADQGNIVLVNREQRQGRYSNVAQSTNCLCIVESNGSSSDEVLFGKMQWQG